MLVSIPRRSNKSYFQNIAKRYLGSYLISKHNAWYKVTKQYSSLNNKLTYLGETEELFLTPKSPHVVYDEWSCVDECSEECCTGQCNLNGV